MSQQITEVPAKVFTGAKGLNDATAPVKLTPGFTFFQINLNATSDVWTRREGREFVSIDEDDMPIMAVGSLSFGEENLGFVIAGDTAYNMEI